MTLREVRKHEFNSDMPSVPREPRYQETILFHSSMLTEHLLCAGTVIGMGTTALNKGDKKPLLFGFHSSKEK